jgi:hypothetical protein
LLTTKQLILNLRSCIIRGSTSIAQAIDDAYDDEQQPQHISGDGTDAACELEGAVAVKPSALLEVRSLTQFSMHSLLIVRENICFCIPCRL